MQNSANIITKAFFFNQRMVGKGNNVQDPPQGWNIYLVAFDWMDTRWALELSKNEIFFPEVTNYKIKLLHFTYQNLWKTIFEFSFFFIFFLSFLFFTKKVAFDVVLLFFLFVFSDPKIKFLCFNWTFSFWAKVTWLLEVDASQYKALFTDTQINSTACIVTSPCCSSALGFCRCFQRCALKWTRLSSVGRHVFGLHKTQTQKFISCLMCCSLAGATALESGWSWKL